MGGLCPLVTRARVGSVGAVRGAERSGGTDVPAGSRWDGGTLPAGVLGSAAPAVQPWGPRVALCGSSSAPAHPQPCGACAPLRAGQRSDSPVRLRLPSAPCSVAAAVFVVPETTVAEGPPSLVYFIKLPTFKQCFGLFQHNFFSLIVKINHICLSKNHVTGIILNWPSPCLPVKQASFGRAPVQNVFLDK